MMNAARKKTPHQLKKEAEDRKAKAEREAAAKEFEASLAYFDGPEVPMHPRTAASWYCCTLVLLRPSTNAPYRSTIARLLRWPRGWCSRAALGQR